MATTTKNITRHDEITSQDDVISCRVTNAVLQYVESLGHSTTRLTEGLPNTHDYIHNPFNWVSLETATTIYRRAARLVKDERIMYRVGLEAPKHDRLGGIEHAVRLLGDPGNVYGSIPKFALFFDKIASFEIRKISDNKAEITKRFLTNSLVSHDLCDYTEGILASIPTIWGLPAAQVQKQRCVCHDDRSHRIEGVKYDADCCKWQVTWQTSTDVQPDNDKKNLESATVLFSMLNRLGESHNTMEQKTIDLSLRNVQLSKVREIALGIDKVQTVEEVYKLIVDLARDIPGIRFVMMQEVDESKKYLITPYYSKIRGDHITNALKAVGFDPDRELGEKPTSQKLRFPLAKFKVARDIIANPTVVVSEHLAELLDGVWPKALCTAIQRISNAEKFVIVPLLMDNRYWCNLLFFLEDEVPVDILEMIGAHCSTAIKNVSALEALHRQNVELHALNTIAQQISTSLEMDALLSNATKEIAHTFSGKACIHFMNDSGNTLELAAQYGIPDEIATRLTHVELNDSALARFINSDMDTITGNLTEYMKQRRSIMRHPGAIPFMSAALCSGGSRSGLLTILFDGKEDYSDKKPLFVSISNQLSLAVDNSRLHSDVLSHVEEIEHARKNLSESEEKLRRIIGSVGDGITVTDLEGKIVEANEAAARLHGCGTREELIGLNAFKLIAKSEYERSAQNMQKTLEEGSLKNIEYTFVKRDGSEFLAELSANLLRDASGNPSGFVASTRDITERKHAENMLLESERKYRLITDGTKDHISMMSLNGTYTYMSPSIRALGYEPEELVGRSGFALMHPDDRKKLMPLLAKYGAMRLKDLFGLKQTSFSEDITFRFRDKSGEWHYVEATASFVDALDGEGLNVLITSRDMTERKQTDDSLRESEERYRMIFESANDILILLDKKGKIIDVNQKLENIGGYDREDLLGKNFRSLTKVMTKKSIAIVAYHFTRRMLGFTIPTYEVEMYRGNSELANIEINAVAVRKGDKIIGSLASLRDITERKRSEANIRAHRELIDRIMATIPNAVLVIKSDQSVSLANKAFYDGFSMERKEVDGKPIDQVIPIKELSKLVTKTLADRSSPLNHEFRHRTNGHDRVLMATLLPMQKEEVLLILNDVSEEREKQGKLYLTDRLASVGEMAAGIAHELNNPLTSVVALSELLREEGVTEDSKADIDAICSEAQRAASVVKSMLAFSRKHRPERQMIQINNVLEEVLKLRAYEHRVNNIEIKTRFDGGLPEVMVDYFQVQQVFLNIVLNAESAMTKSHGRGTLTLATEKVNGSITVKIRDDGPGIEQENVGRLFDPFFTTKEVGEGTGLGLSICYGIITEHGGKISVDSEVEKGATFIIELPIDNISKG